MLPTVSSRNTIHQKRYFADNVEAQYFFRRLNAATSEPPAQASQTCENAAPSAPVQTQTSASTPPPSQSPAPTDTSNEDLRNLSGKLEADTSPVSELDPPERYTLCNNCGCQGHYANDCDSIIIEEQSRWNERVLKCGKSGHDLFMYAVGCLACIAEIGDLDELAEESLPSEVGRDEVDKKHSEHEKEDVR